MCGEPDALSSLSQVEGLIAQATVCQGFADIYYDRLKADGISFPVELFVLGAADSEGKLRSELSEAGQWSGKVRAITNAVSQEVGGIKEEMAQLDQKLEQQGRTVLELHDQLDKKLEKQAQSMLAMKGQLDQKLDRLLAAVGANQSPSE